MDYRNNVKKAEEQYEKGYISGYTTSLEKPCSSSTQSRWNESVRHLVSL